MPMTEQLVLCVVWFSLLSLCIYLDQLNLKKIEVKNNKEKLKKEKRTNVCSYFEGLKPEGRLTSKQKLHFFLGIITFVLKICPNIMTAPQMTSGQGFLLQRIYCHYCFLLQLQYCLSFFFFSFFAQPGHTRLALISFLSASPREWEEMNV